MKGKRTRAGQSKNKDTIGTSTVFLKGREWGRIEARGAKRCGLEIMKLR